MRKEDLAIFPAALALRRRPQSLWSCIDFECVGKHGQVLADESAVQGFALIHEQQFVGGPVAG